MERRALRVRRRAAFEPRVGHRRQVLVQLVDEARFSDPRLAEDDDGLPLAVRRPLPAIDERSNLDVAPDEARQVSRRDGEPAAYPARLHDAVERHRLAHAFQLLRPTVLDHEQPADQALRRGGAHHRVGVGGALDPCRDVRRVPEHRTTVPDDDRPGVHPDPHGERRPGREGRIQRPHRVENRETRTDRSFGVVLPRGRPAKVHEEPVAEVLRHVAAEARHRGGGRPMVRLDHVAPLLGVELLRQRRRADQVAEQHGELAALARRHRRVGLGGRRRHGHPWCLAREPGAAAAAELLAGVDRGSARGTRHGKRRAAFRAEAAVRAVIVVAGWAAHRRVARGR